MKHNYFKTYTQLIILFILLFSIDSFSQNNIMSSINASGNNMSGSSGSVTYSIGQVFYSNIADSAYQITEGIQQSHFENAEDNPGNEDTSEENVVPEIGVSIYPNPTTDFVTLTTDGLEFDSQLHSYQLYNYQGKLLKQNTLNQINTQIDFSFLSSSIYIIQVFVEEKLWETFKIIKK